MNDRQSPATFTMTGTIGRVKKYDGSGKLLAFFSVKAGSYFDLRAWEGVAERVLQMREGDPIEVSGDLRMQKPKDGGDGKWTLQLVAQDVRPLGAGERGDEGQGGKHRVRVDGEERRDRGTSRPTPAGSRAPAPSQGDDDIPF